MAGEGKTQRPASVPRKLGNSQGALRDDVERHLALIHPIGDERVNAGGQLLQLGEIFDTGACLRVDPPVLDTGPTRLERFRSCQAP